MALDAARNFEMRTTDFSCLYDVSWTLHRLQWPRLSNKPEALLSNYRNRANRARQLQEFLHVNITGPEADNTFDEKAGAIQKCTWELLDTADRAEGGMLVDYNGPRVNNEPGSGIVITFSYDASTYTAILYGPAKRSSADSVPGRPPQSLPLLLTKTPLALTKRLFTFLFDTFDLRISPLKLPPSFLSGTLEAYMKIIWPRIASVPVAARSDIINGTLKELKVSFSFGMPVAPQLRNFEVDIPGSTICNLIEASVASQTSLLHILAAHLETHTGIQLPLHTHGTTTAAKSVEVVWMCKVACHAFALSGDGRFKIVEQARNAAPLGNLGFVVQEANEMILSSLLTEAVRVPD